VAATAVPADLNAKDARMSQTRIIYTITDEAPALATLSLLPVIEAFSRAAGVRVETRDISLAGRVLAAFADRLPAEDRVPDDLTELGELAGTPAANIIKLPNISATVPQLKAAIAELQAQGLDLPDYPDEPKSDPEREVRARYARALGSAVNPVLREGNSDRRAAAVVKAFARKHPPRLRPWPADSKTHVAHMEDGDFYGSEQSVIVPAAESLRIEFLGTDGTRRTLKEGLKVEAGEVLDATRMSAAKLRAFYAAQIEDARRQGLLLSLHLKATMMKVSDPLLFGCCVEEFFKPVFTRHGATFARLGVDPALGLSDLLARLKALPEAERLGIEAEIEAVYASRPALAMVDSDKGISNLHVPNDIIIDASMPPMIRDGGTMWGPDGKPAETKALIPDRCYAGIYQAMIEDCKANGAFDPATMGHVSNVGLMARKAEEYGSHDKTFRAEAAGRIRVVDSTGKTLLEHEVEPGDVWRACQTKDDAIRDWVRLAVSRARATGAPAVFWLDARRAHDANLIRKVETYLKDHDTAGLELPVLPPVDAIRFSMARARAGQDTVSVTGNVLRDYLTDLFPILELGTSAKMLSIVPLLAGGGLYETGAGGSAPKHVQQLVAEGHLRWDSLGEFLALAVSLEDLAAKSGNGRAAVLARALDTAVGGVLENRRSPGRKVHDLDNRGSHFYLCLYWAQALAAQNEDAGLREAFAPLAAELQARSETILAELAAAQGAPVDLGGYFRPDPAKAVAAMRPSPSWNALIDAMR
jgi:isocitrate dehydrogenase